MQRGRVRGPQLDADHAMESGSNGCLLHVHNSFELLWQGEESRWGWAGDVHRESLMIAFKEGRNTSELLCSQEQYRGKRM